MVAAVAARYAHFALQTASPTVVSAYRQLPDIGGGLRPSSHEVQPINIL